MIYLVPITHSVLVASYSQKMMFSNFFILHILYPDPDMNIAEYFEYTRKFNERLDELGEDYLKQDRKKRKMTNKSRQASSSLDSNHLPDDIDHIHRAKAAMAARANKEFMGPNDLELSDDEQTSEQMRERKGQ